MRYFNNLKLGVRLLLIFGLIILIGFWGMVKINKELSNINKGFSNTIETKLNNEKKLGDAERFVFQCHNEIVQAILMLETNRKLQMPEVTSIINNLNSAKENITYFDKNLRLSKDIKYENLASFLSAFYKYEESTKRLSSIIYSVEKYSDLEDYYNNNYLPVFNELRSTFLEMSEESVAIMNNNYNLSKENIAHAKKSSFLTLLFIIIILIIGVLLIEKSIVTPLIKTRNFIENLAHGDLPDKLNINTKDEIGQIVEVLNNFITNLKETAHFAKKIGEGNFNVDYKPVSDKDILGNALIEMKKGLLRAKEEEEKRKIEDEKRNWATQGLAKFADILRKDNDNLEKLASDVISNLIDYVGANQGGLFLLNEEDPNDIYIELISSFAYNRKKFLTKKIQIGEGLVGACVQEKQTILLNNIPDDYIEITSGLGEAKPNNLIIIPLKKDDLVYGVIELASFKPFETYEVEFMEKVAESIADTIINVRLNLKSSEYIEKLQQQTEEMKSQDEELRQNIEELQAIHEQMEHMKEEEAKKHQKMLKEIENNRQLLLDILDQIPGKIFVKDQNGTLILLNSEVARVYNKRVDELIGTSDFDNHPFDLAKEYRAKEVEIMNKGAETYVQEEDLTGEKRYLRTTKMPFKLATTGETGLLGFQVDITEAYILKEREKEMSAKIKKLEKEIEILKGQINS